MTTKFTSLAELIERVYRATEFDNIPWADAAEDVLDVLRLIGVPGSYMQKTTNGQMENPVPIIITNFRGTLPDDLAVPGPCRLIHLDSNFNIITFRAMIESQDIFFQSPTVSEEFTTSIKDYAATLTDTSLTMKLDEVQLKLDDLDVEEAVRDAESLIDDIRQARNRIVTAGKYSLDFNPKYKLRDDYIFTNFKEGFVEMTYKAYPIDGMGMPMIPDNIRFIKAVEWYLISRIDLKRWRTSRNASDQKVWEMSDREAQWYIGSARGAAHMPSLGSMEAIKNMILRSIPKLNEFRTGFKNTGNMEQRKF
jgi:hypothetical protein